MALLPLALELITVRSKRKMGEITAQVTIEEVHSDEITITQHPVQQGAAITDHAFKNPAQVTIRAGWSNGTLSALVAGAKQLLSGGGAGGLFGNDYVKDLYEKLLKLQADRKPVEIVTGKRKYKNMLMRSLAVTTDQTTENVLVVTATFQEIIIVETAAAKLPPAEKQATPEKTAPPAPTGAKQVAPAPDANQQALKNLADLKALKAAAEAGG